MVFALHFSATLFMAMIFYGRWEYFYKCGFSITSNPARATGEFILQGVIVYVLYLMWAGK